MTITLNSVTDKILLGLRFAPLLAATVQQIEATNKNLPGATKKQIALATVQAVARTGEDVPEQHIQILSSLVDVLCQLLLGSGKTAAAPAPASSAAPPLASVPARAIAPAAALTTGPVSGPE